MSVTRFRFPFVEMPEAAIALREEVRQFLNEERENGGFVEWLCPVSGHFGTPLV